MFARWQEVGTGPPRQRSSRCKGPGVGKNVHPGDVVGIGCNEAKATCKTQILEDCECHAKEFGVDLEKVKALKVSAKEKTLTESLQDCTESAGKLGTIPIPLGEKQGNEIYPTSLCLRPCL